VRIPLWLKVTYTIGLLDWVGYYLSEADNYDFTQWVWFCYVGLVILGVALWLESPLIFSWQAVSLVLPQMVFNLDVLSILIRGKPILANLTEYLFNPYVPLIHRLLSWFHTPMPFLLLWVVWRMGYDRRALWLQIAMCWLLLLLSYFITDYRDNVNLVFGPGDVQEAIHPALYLAFCMVAYPVLAYLPTHLLLSYTMPLRPGQPWGGLYGVFFPGWRLTKRSRVAVKSPTVADRQARSELVEAGS
jgi:hypothetical protein